MTGLPADAASAEKGARSAEAGMDHAGPLVVPGSKPSAEAAGEPSAHAASASAQASAAAATPLFREKPTAASRFGNVAIIGEGPQFSARVPSAGAAMPEFRVLCLNSDIRLGIQT